MRTLPLKPLHLASILLIGVLSLAACAAPSASPSIPTAPPSILPTQPPSPLSPDANAGSPADRARADLAQRLNVDPSGIVVVSSEPVDWPDACLGIQSPDVMCAQVITPGYKIILEVDGKQYEYHTNDSGSTVRLVEM